MAFGKTEQCMLAVMLACISYLLLVQYEATSSVTGYDFSDAEYYSNAARHSVRGGQTGCPTSGTSATLLVVELTYSNVPSEKQAALSDDVLDSLAKKCTCIANGNCYQWTLVIDEIDYAKTQNGTCENTSRPKCLLPDQLTDKAATVAKIFVKESDLSVTQDPNKCLVNTVTCVLHDILDEYINDTYVEIVVANLVEITTSAIDALVH